MAKGKRKWITGLLVSLTVLTAACSNNSAGTSASGCQSGLWKME